MAVEKLKTEWEQTAQISYTIAAAFGGKKPPEYGDHNPFFERFSDAIEMTKENIGIMEKEFK